MWAGKEPVRAWDSRGAGGTPGGREGVGLGSPHCAGEALEPVGILGSHRRRPGSSCPSPLAGGVRPGRRGEPPRGGGVAFGGGEPLGPLVNEWSGENQVKGQSPEKGRDESAGSAELMERLSGSHFPANEAPSAGGRGWDKKAPGCHDSRRWG